ncbi:MAG: PIN domain-containing protein [Symploca sp. SIO2E6]|nr:PIN domain-containing protein [Symploca sp. SIO2E6]
MSNKKITAVLDACVLHPAPVRDLFMQVALQRIFRPRWTTRIHEEWIRSVLERKPHLSRERLQRTSSLMNENVIGCLVENYESHIDKIVLPDPNDRHVVAAAIQSHSDVIVNTNLKDFPRDVLNEYGLSVQHPDEFLLMLRKAYPDEFMMAVSLQRRSLKKPPMNREEFLNTLWRSDLKRVVKSLEDEDF